MLACLSRRRSRVQIPSRALVTRREERPEPRAGRPVEQRSRHGAVRKPAKRPSSNLGDCGFDSRPCHLMTCVGWASASPTACKAASPKGYAGSTPARRTDNTARSSIGIGYQTLDLVRRVRFPHGLLDDHVVELVDTRRSERRAARHGSSSLPLVTDDCRRGRCPTGSHKAGPPGSIPGPATAGGPVLIRAS